MGSEDVVTNHADAGGTNAASDNDKGANFDTDQVPTADTTVTSIPAIQSVISNDNNNDNIIDASNDTKGTIIPNETKTNNHPTPKYPQKKSNAGVPERKEGDHNTGFIIQVKSEYILKERSPLLTPFTATKDGGDVRDRNNTPNDKHSKRRRGGMNKKRPRDKRISESTRLCLSVVRGTVCPYGDSCKFSHDIKAVLADRPPDIQEIPTKPMILPHNGTTVDCRCPHYRLWGRCDFALMCRVGECHLNMSTGENLTRSDCVLDAKNQPVAKIGCIQNVLRKEVQHQLRKKKYPFVCQRKNAWKYQKQTDHQVLPTSSTTTVPPQTTPTDVDLSPLPTKRKLIDFRNKVYIAPLTTVGNLPFRRIMKHYGADITCGEMAVASNLLEGKPSEWALLKRHPSEDVFGVQIAAGFADQFTRISEVLEKEIDIDFLDMNLGCPIDVICDKGAGSALMIRDKRLKDCLTGMTNVLTCPITIKMRTGWDESKPISHNLIPKIQSWGFDGVGAMMLHGRSRLQRYTKLARWDYISEVCTSLKQTAEQNSIRHIPLIGNGDIFSYADYDEKVLSNPDISPTAMLGRGALIKPWLPTEIKERRNWDISASERLDMLKDFVHFGLEHWGSDDQGVNRTRRFMLEWLSFLYRYVPVGLLEGMPQQMNHRPPANMCGRNDLETLMMSKHCGDWIKICEMLLGKTPEGFEFQPKHKASGYK